MLTATEFKLSADELRLIRAYRSMSMPKQLMLIGTAEDCAERATSERRSAPAPHLAQGDAQ